MAPIGRNSDLIRKMMDAQRIAGQRLPWMIAVDPLKRVVVKQLIFLQIVHLEFQNFRFFQIVTALLLETSSFILSSSSKILLFCWIAKSKKVSFSSFVTFCLP